jgi:dipicolinate synthase subunit A
MKIALAPGDARQEALGRLLAEDGCEVCPYAPGEEADAWLFPLPTGNHPALAELKPGSLALTALAAGEHPHLRLRDYYNKEEVLLRNAAITAEGAIALALEKTERTLLGSRVLILGGGRIARALGPRLRALGAEVTVFARSPAQRAWAESAGCRSLDRLPETPAGHHILFNTIPAPILARAAKGALNIELASAPGGFRDPSGVVIARGLPGKTAPLSAAEALHSSIQAILREEASS